MNNTKLNRQIKRFLRKHSQTKNYFEQLTDARQSARLIFWILYKKSLTYKDIRMTRATIARDIAAYTQEDEYCVKTISRGIKFLEERGLINVSRQVVATPNTIHEYNTFRIPKKLLNKIAYKMFGLLIGTLFGFNLTAQVPRISILGYENINTMTYVDVRGYTPACPSGVFFPKTEEEWLHAPPDRAGYNSRVIVNPHVAAPQGWQRTTNAFVSYKTYVRFTKKAFDPATQLSTMNFNDIFRSSVLDDLTRSEYSTRKDILPEKKVIKREIVNPGKDGSVPDIIEFICCKIRMNRNDLKELLSFTEPLLRVAVARPMGANFSCFAHCAKVDATVMGIHQHTNPALRDERMRLFNIDLDRYLTTGPVGEFQQKKKYIK